LLRSGFTMLYVIFVFFLWYSSIINFSYWWILWLFVATIISLIIFYIKYYKTYLQNEKIILKKSLIKETTTYAFLVFLWASAATILSQIDMQMIIYILWTTDAGYYTNYLSIINIPFLIIWPVLGFLFPVFSELYSKQNIEKIKFIKQIFTKIFLIIGIMFNIFFFIFAPILAYTIFGEKFIESGNILKYSILLLVFNFLLQINFNLMAWVWRVKERVKIISIAIFFNFIANLILIKFMWVEWAALATWLWWVLIWVMSEKKLWEKYFSSFERKPIVLNLAVFVILGVIWYNFVVWDYSAFSRVESFFMLWWCFFIWSLIFLGVNWKECSWFFEEVRKLRR
jgi:O-antigen/teichoic acid export membrane protein